jgi:hypothetical protein
MKPEFAVMTQKPNSSPSSEKIQSSPHPKKARQVRSNIKSMLVISFGCEGIVHQEFVPPGTMVNQHYYQELLWHIRDKSAEKVQNDGRTRTG